MSARQALSVAAFGAFIAAVTACSPPCQTADTDPVRFKDGKADPSGTNYESSAMSGPYLHFPGGRRYQLEHHLKRAPFVVQTYLSFDESGGSFSESAGNQTVIDFVDDQIIQVRNDTCAEFWLRVTAIASDEAIGDAGLADSTTD
jgi:hypothetical protein